MLWPKSLWSYPKPVCGLYVTITRDGSGAGDSGTSVIAGRLWSIIR